MKTISMIGIHKKHASAGFTLVETIISIGIFMILVSIAVGGFVQALHTQGEVGTLISAQSNVSLGVEEMAREIRTGYLFCHDSGSNTPSSSCDSAVGTPCHKNSDGSWSCPALDFFNSNSEHVNYGLSNGALTRSDNDQDNGARLPLTSGDVTVKYLSFRLFGNIEGDGWAPRITILLGIAPSSSDPAIANTVLNFETTVSARQIDCTPGPSPSC